MRGNTKYQRLMSFAIAALTVVGVIALNAATVAAVGDSGVDHLAALQTIGNPATGDDTPIFLLAGIMFAAASGLVALLTPRRKKDRRD